MGKKQIIPLLVVVLVILGFGAAAIFSLSHTAPALPTPTPTIVSPIHAIIGTSVEERALESFTFGAGKTRLLFVGGMHGGYEWNTVLLAYRFMDYVQANPTLIPENLSITVIPSLNPDGVFKVVGKEGRFTLADVPSGEKLPAGTGRFNARGVDLNRNFDCNWKPKSMWKDNIVSAGTKPFSEPEAAAIRDFVLENKPAVVVFWHSQANAIYASECHRGILPETLDVMSAYAKAAGYPAVKTFNAYAVSGDSEGWLASINIPAITVELKTHETIEWEKNLAGIKTLFEYYAK